MAFVTLDFETYYAKDFSLNKLTTEEYIRSPSFEVIGVGLKVDDNPTEWFSGDHKEIKARLDQIDWSESALLCHNAMFDGAILSFIFNIVPAYYFDTLCMARAKHGVDVSGSLANLVKMYGLGQKGTEVVEALGLHAHPRQDGAAEKDAVRREVHGHGRSEIHGRHRPAGEVLGGRGVEHRVHAHGPRILHAHPDGEGHVLGYGNRPENPLALAEVGQRIEDPVLDRGHHDVGGALERDLKKVEKRIRKIKAGIVEIEAMRPGSLTRQKRGESGTYYQLSYTHRGKGRTEYIRKEFAKEIKKEIANYRRLKKMVDELIDLEIERSKIKMKIEIKEED